MTFIQLLQIGCKPLHEFFIEIPRIESKTTHCGQMTHNRHLMPHDDFLGHNQCLTRHQWSD